MKCIEILETKNVVNQQVVLIDHAQFGDSWPFSGAFLLLGDPNDGFPVVDDTQRKKVSVACHWEGSQDEDDFMDFLVSDPQIHVSEGYSGPVVIRLGCSKGCEQDANGNQTSCDREYSPA